MYREQVSRQRYQLRVVRGLRLLNEPYLAIVESICRPVSGYCRIPNLTLTVPRVRRYAELSVCLRLGHRFRYLACELEESGALTGGKGNPFSARPHRCMPECDAMRASKILWAMRQ